MPDQLHLGVGHQFPSQSTYGGHPHDHDEVTSAYGGFTWYLGEDPEPREVIVMPPPIREPKPEPEPIPDPEPEHKLTDHDPNEVITTFDGLDWLTRVLIILLLALIAWIFRREIGSWIPGGGKKNDPSPSQ